MDSIVALIRDLLTFVAVMFALLIALIVVVSKLPDDNPLKRILSLLTSRGASQPYQFGRRLSVSSGGNRVAEIEQMMLRSTQKVRPAGERKSLHSLAM